jgi:hypothetical protein
VKLGNPRIEAARDRAVASLQAEANRAASNVLPIIAEIQRSGATTLRAIAEALNARGVPTPRGGRWHAMSVRNVLARSSAHQSRGHASLANAALPSPAGLPQPTG